MQSENDRFHCVERRRHTSRGSSLLLQDASLPLSKLIHHAWSYIRASRVWVHDEVIHIWTAGDVAGVQLCRHVVTGPQRTGLGDVEQILSTVIKKQGVCFKGAVTFLISLSIPV